MIIRNAKSLIEEFRADDSFGYLEFLANPQGNITLNLSMLWAYHPDDPADDSTLHRIFNAINPTQCSRLLGPTHRALEIMKAGNDIARQTRRGVGNLLICSNSTAKSIDLKSLGLLTHIPNDDVPDDEVVVMYHGRGRFSAVDGPFSFNGTKLKMHPNTEYYIRVIKFTA